MGILKVYIPEIWMGSEGSVGWSRVGILLLLTCECMHSRGYLRRLSLNLNYNPSYYRQAGGSDNTGLSKLEWIMPGL